MLIGTCILTGLPGLLACITHDACMLCHKSFQGTVPHQADLQCRVCISE